MLTIRFSRVGKRKKPFFRIIVSEKHKDTQGHYLELLGHYNPHTKEAVLKADRISHWLTLGAMTSDTVYNLLVKHKIIQSDTHRKVVHISDKRKAKMAEKEKLNQPVAAPAAEAAATEEAVPAAPVEQAPAA
jgi:small subunit ribosomal protein S16